MTFSPNLSRAHKNPARVATTTSIALSGLQTIDGVTLVAGDRVLVKDSGVNNGIYIAASSAWARSPDADQDADILPGMQVYISEGTINGNKYFYVTNDAPIVVGSTSLVFAELGAGGGVTDHGSLTGLLDDDHTQYILATGTRSMSGALTLPELATPSTPSSGFGKIYFKSDGKCYALNDAGTETDLQASGGGTPGGSDTQIQFNNAGAFGGVTGLTYNSTSKKLAFAPTSPTDDVLSIAAGTLTTTKQALRIDATLSNPGGASFERAVHFSTTSAGAGDSGQYSLAVQLLAGYTGAGFSIATWSSNGAAGTAVATTMGGAANYGGYYAATGATTGTNIGQHAFVQGSSTLNIGATFGSTGSTAGWNVGLLAGGNSGGGAGEVGGYFQIGSAAFPSWVQAALVADNTTLAAPIFLARDNGSTVFSILDGGSVESTGTGNIYNQVISSGTTSAAQLSVYNTSGGALGFLTARGATHAGTFLGMSQSDIIDFYVSGASAFLIGTADAAPMVLGVNDAEVLRLNTATNHRVLVTGGTLADGKVAFAVNGTLNASSTGYERGTSLAATSAGSANVMQMSTHIVLNAGYTGNGTGGGTQAALLYNYAAGTGTTVMGAVTPTANFGGRAARVGGTSGSSVGFLGYGESSTVRNYGLVGTGLTNGGSPDTVGVYGTAALISGGGTLIGGMFTLYGLTDSIGTLTSAALIADNGSISAPIFVARDNGTTKLSIEDGGHLTFVDAVNIVVGTSTGTKIGTSTSQKLGFFNATPVVQPTGIADATGGSTVDTEARAAINAVISALESLGLLATV